MNDMEDFEIVAIDEVDGIFESPLNEDDKDTPPTHLSASEVAEVARMLQRVDLSPCTQFLSTGCTLLDLAIANRLPGGFGAGRMSHIYGKASTSKTVIMSEALGSAQRQGGIAYCADAEMTFDFPRAHLFGVDTSNEELWKYMVPTSLEDLWDKHVADAIKKRKKTDPPGIMGVDSLSALASLTEILGKLGEATYGTSRPKIQSEAFRKYYYAANQANLAMVFVDQTRININVKFGDKATVSGGEALKFYASTRIKLSYTGKILNEHKIPVGVEIKAVVVKNKIAPPFREAEFNIIYGHGIDYNTDIIESAVKANIIQKAGSWYSWKEEKLGQGVSNAMETLEKLPEVLKDIDEWLKNTGYSTINKEIEEADKLLLEVDVIVEAATVPKKAPKKVAKTTKVT